MFFYMLNKLSVSMINDYMSVEIYINLSINILLNFNHVFFIIKTKICF